ncbi:MULTISPECIES: hypothetical protein [unclassified Streptomyces]|uniref:hypothetical protein n=1 Tax=unclassified Streptomyces TaxID=2593676 RepID=UPI00225B68D6|nr:MULTISPECIES: hypothetical protein [unclassified Streptomyces]WSP56285.1 hypothetical protein OG306_19320 [Streptomyces sp. NBC_01241]WSU23016.1 hypothetical protein OG508_20005 [Streptomyces sp. NBC_01108]MCX4788005.1 hypothetical protein [Streptomyces sp. NBC_01221]MCX4796233.1 hypothetical protein [Streptomyces sp. NBC_01242]WSJ37483.1 hypothetical protein OG772_16595 [Streptomyces sp. NBC_01321]
MASYEEHEQAAIDLLAPLRGAMGGTVQPDYRLQMAQVEALLALAAAIAGRHQGDGAPGQPPIPNGPAGF